MILDCVPEVNPTLPSTHPDACPAPAHAAMRLWLGAFVVHWCYIWCLRAPAAGGRGTSHEVPCPACSPPFFGE